MAKKIKRIKLKWPAYVLILVIVLFICSFIFIKLNKKYSSIEYKLESIGYTDAEIIKLKTLDTENLNFVLEKEKQTIYIQLIDQKYFIKELFLDYIDYNKEVDLEISDLIAYVNTKSFNEEYVDIIKTDTTKGSLMLVNKTHYLEKTYKPSDLKNVSNWYAYEGRTLSDVAYQAYISMFNTAKDAGLNLVLANGYKSYESQETLFNTYKQDYGERAADGMATRAGFSEYQTGLALNINKYYGTGDFKDTDEYTWLIENCSKFGFILRYPEGKESITGYEFESYHFRYVGEAAASIIMNENITLEEYYAYYLK